MEFLKSFAAGCNTGSGGDILGFPTWYKYLDCNSAGEVVNFKLEQTWLVVAAALEILLRTGVLLAVVWMIWGGIQMMLSRGNPEQINAARGTMINAAIGLVIAVMATVIVSFVASRFS